MYATIKMSGNIHHVVRYNEQKVEDGRAKLLYAGNFLKEAAALTRGEKIKRFSELNTLNERTVLNVVHMYLSFHREEAVNDAIMRRIAIDYMRELGFGAQPYLVYRHNDAGHAHFHIVTTPIRPDGERIYMHPILKDRRKEVCLLMEKKYDLHYPLTVEKGRGVTVSANPKRIKYRDEDGFKAISERLRYIFDHYKLSSLAELSAVLRLYNFSVSGGVAGGKLQARKGIVYYILDEQGKPAGASIPASDLPGNPGRRNLEAFFSRDVVARERLAAGLKLEVELTCLKDFGSWGEFSDALGRRGIQVMAFADRKKTVYDMVFVDARGHVAIEARELVPGGRAVKILSGFGLEMTAEREIFLGAGRDIDRGERLLAVRDGRGEMGVGREREVEVEGRRERLGREMGRGQDGISR